MPNVARWNARLRWWALSSGEPAVRFSNDDLLQGRSMGLTKVLK
jgi:hypothetical protein